MSPSRRLGLSCVALTLLTAAVLRAEPSASTLAFERLTSLVGEWKGEQGGVPITVTYSMTANGSALMEEFKAKSGVMITMFSVDGDHLVATHYCSAGNQPQMATKAVSEGEAKSLTFSLVRVTGLVTPEDWHNTGLTITLDDRDHLTQEWTYLSKGETGNTVFRFARVR